jgi:UDP-N-acetylglucosamine 3-dehydrogenase
MNTLRAAVIGLGAMGANHARVYADVPGVELAAVVDTDARRVEAATRGRTARGYGDVARMLAEERPDLASVAVPTRAHAEVAAALIERGVPVLVEKPLAATIAEGERLRDMAAAAGVVLTAGHVERFNPAVVELKRRLQAGELGRVFQVHARRVGPFPERVRDVGVVLDLAPHDIDVMRFLLESEVVRVQAETEQRIATEHEDMLAGLLRFENGVVGVLDGMFVVDYLARELRFYENAHVASQPGDWAARHLKGVSEGAAMVLPVEKREPLRLEIEAFVAAVRGEAPVAVTPDDALAAMAAAEALIRSARTGEPVTLGR